ncbi:MAG: DUF1565 domain-containing protein [Bryobacteraceae bacterium]
MKNHDKRARARISAVLSAISLFAALDAGTATAQTLCQPQTDSSGRECFVSLTGNDSNPGTITQPFRTIAKGVSTVQAGDILNLRGGEYVEPVIITAKHGTAALPIMMRSYPGENASIDGSLPEFRTLNNQDWEPAKLSDPNAHPDEYVSVTKAPGFIRGAFLDGDRYTRLITYSRLEDLRANNETFDKITAQNDSRPGPEVVDCDANGKCVPAGYRHPWVYMGPGIWIDRNASPTNPQRVHIRLSHTHNNIPGLADYAGETDPRRLRLAISPEPMVTFRVQGSSHLRFERLSIRYGGDFTSTLTNVTGLVFDHVRFLASSHGVRTGKNTGSTFTHCEFDGGKPGWYFRNDGKMQYKFLDGGTPVENNLGKQTMRSLFVPSPLDTGTTIAFSEFHDAHDLYLGGSRVKFHHNWIYDLNDEGLFLDAYGKEDVQVYENVILKTLSPISFAGDRTGDQAEVGGPFYVYRNLVDVRVPTAGHRPRFPGDTAVWRYGHTFKSNGEDGPHALFQNTFLVYGVVEQASYLHFRNLNGNHQRRSFNNIFVAVNPDAESDRPITFVPSPSFPAQTGGNAYHRIGMMARPRYRFLQYVFAGQTFRAGTFDCLEDCSSALRGSLLFNQSKSHYPPGYEADSIESDPQFRQIGTDGVFRPTDDLRLRDTSPARGAGVTLPPDLLALDGQTGPPAGAPDIGCYRFGSGPLQVGVDGRRSYPGSDQ